MKPNFLMRMASVLMLLHTAGHTFGALTWKNAPNLQIARLISGMEQNRFNFMGRSVSLAAFHEGYGIAMIFVLLLISIMLWQLSTIYDTKAARMIPMLSAFLVVLGIVELVYFFPFAAAFSLLAAICVIVSIFRIRKISSSSVEPFNDLTGNLQE